MLLVRLREGQVGVVYEDPHHKQRRAGHETGGQLDGGHTQQCSQWEVEGTAGRGCTREQMENRKRSAARYFP